MPFDPLPNQYRKATPLLFNVDYFDFVTNAGYKLFYLAESEDSASVKYFLTTDSTLVSDDAFPIVGANGTDVDFDITFNNTATLAAAPVTISYTTFQSDPAHLITIAWTVYHVDKFNNETSLGTITDAGSTGGTNAYRRRTVKFDITKKKLNVGEKLRVNAVVSSNAALASANFYIDPSGHITQTGGRGGTITSSATVNLPFEVDL